MNLVCESLEELFEDRTLLRTLSLKSKLGFGANGQFPISSLIKSMPGYLKWVYYTYEGITFSDEILDMLQIPLDKRINKPGTNPDLWKELQTPGERISKRAYLGLNRHPGEEKHLSQYDFQYGVREKPEKKSVLQSKNRTYR